MQRTNRDRIRAGISIFIFSMVSCRPVFAIGWGEFLIFALVVVLLIGPPVYRFLRRLEKSREQKKK